MGIGLENTPVVYILVIGMALSLYLISLSLSLVDFKRTEDEEADGVISKVKKAQHRALNNKLTGQLTPQELEKEERIKKEQLMKIYSLLKENKDEFGEVSLEEIEDQVSMYHVS